MFTIIKFIHNEIAATTKYLSHWSTERKRRKITAPHNHQRCITHTLQREMYTCRKKKIHTHIQRTPSSANRHTQGKQPTTQTNTNWRADSLRSDVYELCLLCGVNKWRFVISIFDWCHHHHSCRYRHVLAHQKEEEEEEKRNKNHK